MSIKRCVITLFTLLTLIPAVQAGPIPVDLSILAKSGFGSDSIAGSGDVQHEATMQLMIGGTVSQATVSDVTVSNPTPLSGLLSELGDGIAISSSVAGGAGGVAAGYFFDFSFALTNNSLVNSYFLSFILQFDHDTAAAGDDAYAESQVVLLGAALQELFFSELMTDTLYGDVKNRSDANTFGISQTDSGSFRLDMYLNAGTAAGFRGELRLEAADFAQNGEFSLSSNVQLTLEAVKSTNPPIPQVSAPASGMLVLLGFALLGFFSIRNVQ